MKKNKIKFLKITILTLSIFVIIFTLFTMYLYKNLNFEREYEYSSLINSESRLVGLEQKLLRKEFKRLISDIFIIKNLIEDNLTNTEHNHNFEDVEKLLISIINNKRIYDQLRYIDENGQEVIRVDLENGTPVVCKKDKLQNKADRYYFKDTMAIENGEIYISKLDLNKEHGEIEQPLKPMIRFATKIYDQNGNSKGIIISNYYAKVVINDFIDIANRSVGSPYIVNYDSYWISNIRNAYTEFAFMYDYKKDVNFKNKYPDAWNYIFNNKQDFYEDNTDIFFSKEVIPFKDIIGDDFIFPVKKIILGDGNLRVISHIEKADIPKLANINIINSLPNIIKDNKFNIITIFFISFLMSILIYLYGEQKKNLKFFSEFDYATEIFNRRAGLEKIQELIHKTKNSNTKLFIIFIDVNGLKTVNDKLGHKHGDKLIKSVANLLKDSTRANDIVLRYGGDEFVMCLQSSSLETPTLFWDRVTKKINEINNSKEFRFNISLSHGVSLINNSHKNVVLKKYIDEADKLMYEEKIEIKKYATIIK